jgi:hypothetical protein
MRITAVIPVLSFLTSKHNTHNSFCKLTTTTKVMNEPMDVEKSNAPNGGARRGGGGRGAPRKRNNRKPSGEGRETNSTTNKSNGAAKGSMPPVKRVKRSDSNICFAFAKTGSCGRGDACRFSHEAPAENGTAEPASSETQKKNKVVVAPSSEGSAPKESAHIKQVIRTSD